MVSSVNNSEKMSKDESITFVKRNQEELQLTDKQFQKWGGKRYLVLIEIVSVVEVKSLIST